MSKPKSPAPATATFTKPERVAPAQRKGNSTVANPVGVTWVHCLNNPGSTRAQLTKGAQALGVAYYTARTQVDRFIRWDRGGRDPKGLPQGVSVGAPIAE